jgi:hypothetical protein
MATHHQRDNEARVGDVGPGDDQRAGAYTFVIVGRKRIQYSEESAISNMAEVAMSRSRKQ